MNPFNVNTLPLKHPRVAGYFKHIVPAPTQIFYSGADPTDWLVRPKVAIVGSRKATAYGQAVTAQLAGQLSRSGVIIISGLALGIDSVAHRAALEARGTTIAVMPTPLPNIYPSSHLNLARQIVENGGSILTEYPEGSPVYRHNFIARNRIVSGLADILLITEATANSGTMHTARFALEQEKTVMAVPGNINSPASEGCNNLIKSGGVPVTDVGDVLFALGVKGDSAPELPDLSRFDATEQILLKLIASGVSDQEDLAATSKMNGAQVVSALTGLELSGSVRPEGAGRWALNMRKS